MQHDATGASLTDVFRSLNVAPDYKDALVALAQKVSRLEHEAEHQQMLYEAEEEPPRPVPPSGPRHKKDRPHLRVIRGGLAGFAPAAVFLCHGGAGPVVMGAVRWVWRAHNDHVRYVVAAGVLGLAGAWTAGAVMVGGTPPAAPALIPPSAHDRPPARPLHHHPPPLRYPVPSGMARSAQQRRRRHHDARVTPSPSPSPASAVLPTVQPSPAVTVTSSLAWRPMVGALVTLVP